MHYDYRAGKKRIDEILDSGMAVIEKNRLPKNDELTFDNSYLSWISAIFIDIRESTELMARDDQEYVAKIVRSPLSSSRFCAVRTTCGRLASGVTACVQCIPRLTRRIFSICLLLRHGATRI